MKIDILAIGVHPDDIELSACGTLLRHIDMGYSVALCDLTQGELGTRGNAALRLQEAEMARIRMGAVARENLGMSDGFFTHNEENMRKIIQVIRKYQPDIVLANAVSDRHPDHGRASKLISEACFYAGLSKIEIHDSNGSLLPAWRPTAVYHYIQDRHRTPDFVVDISSYIEKKMDCIMAFSSQFYNPDSGEPDTPISSMQFLDFLRAKNRVFARDINVEYAEAFNVERTIGVKDLFDLQ
jgi:bacillithiol biosynthesis deacetylase BshB1